MNNDVGAPTTETPGSPRPPLRHVKTQWGDGREPGSGPSTDVKSTGASTLDSQPLER